jgi:hypothetical protein
MKQKDQQGGKKQRDESRQGSRQRVLTESEVK